MSFELSSILHEMGVFALGIVGALGLMAVAAVAVFVERLWVFARTRRRSRAFSAVAATHLSAGDHRTLARLAGEEKGNPLAELLGGGLQAYHRALADPSEDVGAVELARREIARRADSLSAQLRRGLNLLASVGSVAPFVGLLGTVVGIIGAFQGIAAEGSGGLGAVSAGIAEALIVTALGLLVAIPGVLAFNYLSARSDALMLAIDQSRGEFVDHLEAHHSRYAADEGASARAA